MLRTLAATCVIAVTWPSLALAQTTWSVSCSENGKVVHLETIGAEGNPAREAELLQRYPDATCVYLSDRTLPVEASADSTSAYSEVSLDAALRAIAGDAPIPPTVPTTPIDIAVPPELSFGLAPEPVDLPELIPFSSTPRFRPASANWVRLAVYQSSDISDALADWTRISSAEPLFRYVTPAVTRTADGYTMLSAGPVPSKDINQLCLAAIGLQLDCIPGDTITEPPADTARSGFEFLAYQFPMAMLSLDEDRMSVRPTFPMQDGTAGRGDLNCLATALQVSPKYPPYVGASPAYPPLPRRRPSGH